MINLWYKYFAINISLLLLVFSSLYCAFFLFLSCFSDQDCTLSRFGTATENQLNAFSSAIPLPLPWLSVAVQWDFHWISPHKTKKALHYSQKHVPWAPRSSSAMSSLNVRWFVRLSVFLLILHGTRSELLLIEQLAAATLT